MWQSKHSLIEMTATVELRENEKAEPSEGKGHTFESCRVRHLSGLF